MDRPSFNGIDERNNLQINENDISRDDETIEFDFQKVSEQSVMNPVYINQDVSIYHTISRENQYSIAVYFQQRISTDCHTNGPRQKQSTDTLSPIRIFYQKLQELQIKKEEYSKHVTRIVAIKHLEPREACNLLQIEEYQNLDDCLLVFFENFEWSVEDDISERCLNQNTILCEDQILESFGNIIATLQFLGRKLVGQLVLSSNFLVVCREKTTKLLPVYNRNESQLESLRKSQNLPLSNIKNQTLSQMLVQRDGNKPLHFKKVMSKKASIKEEESLTSSTMEVELEEKGDGLEKMEIEEDGVKEDNIVLEELALIYLRVSAFVSLPKFNPLKKNRQTRIHQIISSLIEYKIASLFEDIFAEDRDSFSYKSLLALVTQYREQKLVVEALDTTCLSNLCSLLPGKTTIVINYKCTTLEKLYELEKIFNMYAGTHSKDSAEENNEKKSLFWISSFEFKADLCGFGDEGAGVISSILNSINPLGLKNLILSLRRNSISEEGMEGIAQFTGKCRGLQTLRLFFSYNRIRDKGLQFVLQGITQLEDLEVLDLRFFDNQITVEGCKGFDLLKDLEFKHVKYLNISLGNNQIQDEGCQLLAMLLCNVRNVRQLSIFLESNQITSIGIAHLKKAFIRKNQIKYLIFHAMINSIQNEGIIEVLANISKLTTLTSLEIILNENELSEKAGIALGGAIKNMQHLTSLILSVRNNKIGNLGVNSIGESLKGLRQLENLVLSLTNNNITDNGGIVIGKSLKHLTKIQKLHLVFYENSINNRSGKFIGEGLSHLKNLHYLILGLGDNNVRDEGAIAIGACLATLTQIKIFEIYLQNNNVGTTGATAIAQGLAGMTNLRCLVFQIQHSEFGDEPMVALSKSIRNLKSLKSLDIYVERCGIGEEGGEALGNGLAHLINLKVMVLDLDQNNIGARGGKAIGDAFKSMHGLVDLKLYLKKNNLMQEGGAGLFAGLPYLDRLKSLNIDLYKNYTGDSSIIACGRALKQLKELRNLELSITYNSITQIGAHDFADNFAQCTMLSELYLYMQKNNVTPAGAVSIGNALSHFTQLQQLKISFGNNQIEDEGLIGLIDGISSCRLLRVLFLYAYNIGMSVKGCLAVAENLKSMTKLERFEFFPSNTDNVDLHIGLAQLASTVIQNHQTLQNVRVENPFWEENIRIFLTPRPHNQIRTMQTLLFNRQISNYMICNPKAILWDLFID